MCTIAHNTLPPSTHELLHSWETGGDRHHDPAAKCVDGLGQLQQKIDAIVRKVSIIATIFTHRHQDHIGDLDAISQLYQAPLGK